MLGSPAPPATPADRAPRRSAVWPMLAVTLAVGGASGCSSSAMPRSAEIAPFGEMAGEVLLPFTYAPGTARGETTAGPLGTGVAGEPGTIDGSSAAHFGLWPGLQAMGSVLFFEGALRFGLGGGLELGPIASVVRQGGELRWGPVQQADGAPLSIALSAAGAFQPFFDASAWWRTSVDLSRRFGALQLSVGASASHGPVVHHIFDVPERFDGGDRAVLPRVRGTLRGWRLSLPVGVHFDTADDGPGLTWGVVPHLSIDESATGLECVGCTLDVQTLEVPWGISVVVGARFGTADER